MDSFTVVSKIEDRVPGTRAVVAVDAHEAALQVCGNAIEPLGSVRLGGKRVFQFQDKHNARHSFDVTLLCTCAK